MIITEKFEEQNLVKYIPIMSGNLAYMDGV